MNVFIAVKDKEWEEDEFDAMDECVGDGCDGEDRPACDECEVEDALCMENCWSVVPPEKETKRPTDKNKPKPHGRQKPGKTGDNRLLKGGRNNQGRGGRMPKKMMRKVNKKMLWKPNIKGRRMHQLMGKKHMGLMKSGMKRQGMRPSMMGHPSRMGAMKPMMPGMMMHPERFMGPMKFSMKPVMQGMKYGMDKMKIMGMTQGKPYMGPMMMGPMMMRPMMKQAMMGQDRMMGHRMMHHRMETGPIIQSRKSLRGEFYTNVIFARDGTCNAIVHDLSCFGEQKNIRMRAGRVGKTPISVPMCPRPTIMKRTTAQFTCDTGASFLKPILVPVRCSYAPCNPGFWLPDWSKDQYWDGDNSYPGDHWGSKDWWRNDQRGDNKNWFLENPQQNHVDKTKTWRNRELKWRGQDWRNM